MNRIKELLNLLPHHLQVEFAIYCVNDVKELLPKEGLLALELTQKWLKNPLSVANKELIDAAAASAAASSADNAANAASSAAHAAHAAYSAASYADYKEGKLKQYETHLISMFDKLTALEKTIYNLEESV